MTARDTIAAAVFKAIRPDGYWTAEDVAAAVTAAIRAMPVQDQAELIGGGVETSAWKHWPDGGTRRRVRGPWTA